MSFFSKVIQITLETSHREVFKYFECDNNGDDLLRVSDCEIQWSSVCVCVCSVFVSLYVATWFGRDFMHNPRPVVGSS